jgi:hypothetical protein
MSHEKQPAAHGSGCKCRNCKTQPVIEAAGLDVSETAPPATKRRRCTTEYMISIADWLCQFTAPTLLEKRFKPIVLIGDVSRQDWRHAVESSGPEVFQVDCSGLKGTDCPNLQGFDRDMHSCVVFENIRCETVLSNTQIFTSPMTPVELNGSCSLDSYSQWLYMVPMMLWMGESHSKDDTRLSTECVEWLRNNVFLVQPPPTCEDTCCIWNCMISLAVVLFNRLPGGDVESIDVVE